MATTVQIVDVSTATSNRTLLPTYTTMGEGRPRYDDRPKETNVPERASRRLRSARGFMARRARENG
jgi:hypothetical protein